MYKDLLKFIDSSDVMLDHGCGEGGFGMLTRTSTRPKKIIGIDVNLSSLKKNTELDYAIVATADDLPFRSNVFDIIASRGVLEHLEHPQAALKEIARVSKFNGFSIFRTPNKLNPMMFMSFVLPLKMRERLKMIFSFIDKIEGNYPTYYRCNTKSRLCSSLEMSGLTTVYFRFDDIGFDFIKNRILKLFLIGFKRITDLSFFKIFKPFIDCAAEKDPPEHSKHLQ